MYNPITISATIAITLPCRIAAIADPEFSLVKNDDSAILDTLS